MKLESGVPIPWKPILLIVWAFAWRGLLLSLIVGFAFGLLGALVGFVFGFDPNLGGKYASYLGSFIGFAFTIASLIDDTFGGYQLRLTKVS